jgi:hypothetical protein
MGYASYDTPLGPAGYGIEDICNEDGCGTEIDRGLSFLCGMTPGRPDEHGCGLWFCDEHLFMGPENVRGFLCNSCLLKYDGVDKENEEEGLVENA